ARPRRAPAGAWARSRSRAGGRPRAGARGAPGSRARRVVRGTARARAGGARGGRAWAAWGRRCRARTGGSDVVSTSRRKVARAQDSATRVRRERSFPHPRSAVPRHHRRPARPTMPAFTRAAGRASVRRARDPGRPRACGAAAAAECMHRRRNSPSSPWRRRAMTFIRRFDELGRADVAVAGGKGANRGERARAGLPVPPGVVITVDAYDRFYEASGLAAEVSRRLERLEVDDP